MRNVKDQSRRGENLLEKKWMWMINIFIGKSILTDFYRGGKSMYKKMIKIVLAVSFIFLLTFNAGFSKTVKLRFYYPVGVTGPLAQVIDGMTNEFNASHPNIKVEPVYCGNYNNTMQKVQAAVMSGRPPDIAVVEISELYTLLALDSIIPLDKYIEKEGGKDFLNQYFSAFFGNAKARGKIWGFPFQRSTPVLYWNKDLFLKHAAELKAEGLDPERAPRTWYELVEYAKILTERSGNETKVYGLILPGGWNDWIFEGFVRQNGAQLISDDGKKAYFDTLDVLEPLILWYKLTNILKVSPPLRPWNTTPIDFAAGKAAMMYYSTGGLPTIRKQAKFRFGVAFLPKNVQYGTPVGGGDFHIFRKIPKENQDAAWEFIKFMTTPEKAAYWSRKSGYVCINKKGLELPEMKKYLAKYPNAKVAAEQLVYSYPKMMATNYQMIRKILTTNLDDVMLGRQTPKKALEKIQKEVQQILEQY